MHTTMQSQTHILFYNIYEDSKINPLYILVDCSTVICWMSLFVILEVSGLVVVLLFYVHGKHLRSCRDGQLT